MTKGCVKELEQPARRPSSSSLEDARFSAREKIWNESRRGFPGAWHLTISARPLADLFAGSRCPRPPTFPRAKKRLCRSANKWGPSDKLEWNGTWYSRSWANMSDSCSPSFRSHLFYHLSHHISGIKSRKEENYWDTAGRYGSLMQRDVNERA